MKDDALKLQNQLCFPLYALSKEIIKKYTPLLDELHLTYTQYLVMMVMWEKQTINVKAIGDKLYLDSGTLTPLLKKLEVQRLITRQRDTSDERSVIIQITESGLALKEKASDIPAKIGSMFNLNEEELIQLYTIIHKLLKQL
ncbi:MAG: transcriptional regulator [Erysipelotrichaceae bacterium]|nr:MAG: transcriptional [Erysipelotrichaceae bacterium]TXT18872.1 MAG: transcriptional regulator [Erysipelotrichaceae bacterium]